MALADRTRQRGKAATRQRGGRSVLEPLERRTVIGHRVAALPLCRVAASCLPEPLRILCVST